ncbi:MAG: UbiX family flavin prenyltransferase [Candidatus Scalindua sp.]|jgi:4-hydroxy-3-polyprenylbenzoate decarboxylase|nr:UbiX family flavin prenyltransferase [Candidatus Scalindua sp.]MBT5306587.1 UbiX family flavin prenyltransferase [Candidatus Scalindua sp.]MBT6050061.1 UbiX family flavin prenyltransferase [Candidatus Scalindua sp.]MBT6229900.1 UbiX family flavin prenyltransferase [Candidatus Scalindua sp.]MBT6562041.1 UbiX family flavin prenyltransferase [Candidatus Scalindua sp.]
MENIIVGITGASGVVYGQRLLQALSDKSYPIHLSVSEAAIQVIESELNFTLNLDKFNISKFIDRENHSITYHHISDIAASISSGTLKTKAMIIAPCSMNTLCSIANGIASNLIQRAASVTLKEGRKLIVMPRETPLTPIHLENMLKLSKAQTCILPAMPGYYYHPKTIDDQVDFMVGKALDYIGIEYLPYTKKSYGEWRDMSPELMTT